MLYTRLKQPLTWGFLSNKICSQLRLGHFITEESPRNRVLSFTEFYTPETSKYHVNLPCQNSFQAIQIREVHRKLLDSVLGNINEQQ